MNAEDAVGDALNELKDYLEDAESCEKQTPLRKIEVAQVALKACVALLEEAIDEKGDEHARAYLLDHLKIMASEDHGFLSRDLNFDKLRENWEKTDEPEGDESEE